MTDTNYIGNISTIVKYVSMMFAGLFISFMASKGMNFNMDESILSDIICAVLMFVLAHIDAKNPNTIYETNKEITLEDYINYGIENFDLQLEDVEEIEEGVDDET